MKRLAHFLWAALLLLIATPAVPAESEDTSREVLVMLQLPAAHFRPGSNYGGDYDDAVARAANRRLAQRIAKRQGMELVDDWPMPLLGVDCYVLRLRDGQDSEEAIAALSREPQVRWAQPMQMFEAQAAVHGDPLYPAQPAAAAWRLDELHRVATGRGVRVAVIDSQIEARHPDLAGQVVMTRNFVTTRPAGAEAHGTGVAGVIAAKANNGIGIAGIAPGAKLYGLRACWPTGGARTVCDTLSLAKALQFALGQGVQILNLSISGPADPLLDRLLDMAEQRGIAIVAAYDPSLPNGGFPASKAGVTAVADSTLKLRSSAIYGAPGSDIPTTQPGGRWFVVSGSSYAAAHVSGLLALMREQRPAAQARFATRAGSGNEIDPCKTLIPTTAACDCSCSVAQLAGSGGR